MLLSNYETVYLLCVDYKVGEEAERVQRLLMDKGVPEEKFHLFIDGKGNELPPEWYDQYSPYPPPTWQDGPYAYAHFCAMRRIVQRAKTAGAETLLFTEDDLIFTPDFDDAVNRVEKQLPPDWDMLYYGANHSNADTSDYSADLIKVCGSQTTHCVGIRCSVYDAILALPEDRTIDWNMARRLHHNYNVYSIFPAVALQKPGYSQLWKREVDYTDLFRSKGRR